MRRPIAGLRTIVTGASSGIGRALVEELIRGGAKVIALARRAERLERLAAELAANGGFYWLAGDVACRDDRAAALDLATRHFGGLDCLVNNAGIGGLGRFDTADEARLRRIMEVNFFAPAEFIRQALPLLRHGNRPIIVNIGSVLGHRAVPHKSEYCASKFALHGFSDALRLELARDEIDVLLVSPSTTTSEFFDTLAGSAGDDRSPPARTASEGLPAAASPFGAMSPETVARRTIAAIAAGRREIILSAGGKLLVWLDRLCPPLADWLVARFT